MKFALPILALLSSTVSVAVFAAPVAADKMLVASSPAADAIQSGVVDAISLDFAEKVELLNVSLIAPDGGEQPVFEAGYKLRSPKKKGTIFSFVLIPAATAPGRYSISYLLTSKSIKSLNGYVRFEIAGEAATDTGAKAVPFSDLVAPDLLETQPADQSTVTEPVADILMRFGSTVRLMEAVLITPDQNRIALIKAADSSEAEEAGVFVLPFPQAVTLPGTYLIDYTVHQQDADGAWFQTSAYTSFIIAEPAS